MHHITLNTGDTRQSPREEVAADIIPLLHDLARNGGDIPNCPGYSASTATTRPAFASTPSARARPRL